jgi:hypothetical protein
MQNVCGDFPHLNFERGLPVILNGNVLVRTGPPALRRSANRTCLQVNSLQTGSFTGNLPILAARNHHYPEDAVVQRLLGQFLRLLTGNFT